MAECSPTSANSRSQAGRGSMTDHQKSTAAATTASSTPPRHTSFRSARLKTPSMEHGPSTSRKSAPARQGCVRTCKSRRDRRRANSGSNTGRGIPSKSTGGTANVSSTRAIIAGTTLPLGRSQARTKVRMPAQNTAVRTNICPDCGGYSRRLAGRQDRTANRGPGQRLPRPNRQAVSSPAPPNPCWRTSASIPILHGP